LHTSGRTPIFENRYDAGVCLAGKLDEYKKQQVIVLAIPNGGVPVAVAVARALGAELDIVVARKLPIPLRPEGGFGAVADDGTTIFNQEVLKSINLNDHQINYQVNKVRSDIRQRSLLYRNNRALSIVKGKIAIIVDDGLASGYTMLAAVESVRRRQPSRIVVGVPAASEDAVKQVAKAANTVITVETAHVPKFYIADYFRYWNELSDEEGVRCFKEWQVRQGESDVHSFPSRPAPVEKYKRGLY
jgi:putative phosphoribosyl transferase